MKIVFLALLLGLSAALSAESPYRLDRPHPVVDPLYGKILFEYYQKRYFAAMTSIIIGLENGELPTQAERSKVLLGALYATYGMPQEAENLFNQLLGQSVDPDLATRVWLHLSGLYYQQQKYQKALDTLDGHVTEIPKDLRQNYYALRTRILMKLGRYDDTSLALDGLESYATLSGYLKYNLAVSRINVAQGHEGEALLWQLVNLKPGNEEINSLKDKSILALGVHYLRVGEARKAQHVLGVARVQGPYSETGLLLHARAWLATREPLKALGSLQELGKRSMQFEEAQEAAISLPFLYEQLGDFGKAQQAYRDAIQAYTAHYKYLSELEEKVRSGRWFEELAEAPVWSTAMDPLPPFEPSRVESFATFQHLFARHDFHAFWLDYHKQWRQIRLLEQWQQRMPAMHELLAAHIKKHRAQKPEAMGLLQHTRDKAMKKKFETMEASFETARRKGDYVMFATPEQEKLLSALNDARQKAARWGDKIRLEQTEKLEFYRRIIQWEIERNIVPLQWQRERELQSLKSELDTMQNLYDRVAWAARGDLNSITTLGHELAGMHNELTGLVNRGNNLLARQQDAIERLALRQIEFTRTRLRAFTAECWAALGDLQHRALREKYKPVMVLEQKVSTSAE